MQSNFLPGVFATICSHKRPANVAMMSEKLGPATWFVPEGQGRAYRDAGAPAVVEVPEPPAGESRLVHQRNTAFKAAWAKGLPCLQVDDDMVRIKQATYDAEAKKATAKEVHAAYAVALMLQRMAEAGAKLIGGPPVDNPFYYTGKPLGRNKFVIACFMVVQPCELLMDPRLPLKHDYDYTMQHITRYGCAARCDDLLMTFKHYGNAGGCNDYRNAEGEQRDADLLMQKWPASIKPHPRRAHEVSLRYRGPA